DLCEGAASGGLLVQAARDVAVAVLLGPATDVVVQAAVVAATARDEPLGVLVRPRQIAVHVALEVGIGLVELEPELGGRPSDVDPLHERLELGRELEQLVVETPAAG